MDLANNWQNRVDILPLKKIINEFSIDPNKNNNELQYFKDLKDGKIPIAWKNKWIVYGNGIFCDAIGVKESENELLHDDKIWELMDSWTRCFIIHVGFEFKFPTIV
jgi:hypothetical protein